MNTIQILRNAAELEKKAFTEYVTSYTTSGITTLVQGGMDFEKAAALVKEACAADPKVISSQATLMAFEKTAEYIAELEAKVEGMQKVAEETEVTVAKLDENNPLSKLASIGFTDEEIRMISELPENLITKVASSNTQPQEMGGGVGFPREKTDPLLEFILG